MGPQDTNVEHEPDLQYRASLSLHCTLDKCFLTKWVNGCELKGHCASNDAWWCTLRPRRAECAIFPTDCISLPESIIESGRDTLFMWLEAFGWNWSDFLKLQRHSHLAPVMIWVEKASATFSFRLAQHKTFTFIFFYGTLCSCIEYWCLAFLSA